MSIDLQSLLHEQARPFVNEYSTVDGELAAVSNRTKAVAMYDWPKAAIDGDAEGYEDLLSKGLDLGLTVIHRPYTIDNDGERSLHVRTFVLHDEEAWRVPAFMALMEMLHQHGWSDGMECLSSKLLGYSSEQIRDWIAFSHHRHLGWRGTTTLMLLDGSQRELVEALGSRCIDPLAVAVAEIAVFVPGGFLVVRNDVDEILVTHGLHLARVAVRSSFSRRLFGAPNIEPVRSCSLTSKNCGEFNAALLSGIEFWQHGGWK